jgi:hypothetical protein
MPCGYHVNPDDGLLTITIADVMDVPQLVAFGQQLLADPEFDAELPHLVDLRGLLITPDSQDGQAIRDFVLESYCNRVHSSIAIVIDDSLAPTAIAGLFHVTCAMKNTELFDHYEQALKWLMRREFASSEAPGAWRSLP